MELFLKALLNIPMVISIFIFLFTFLGKPVFSRKLVFLSYGLFYLATTITYLVIGFPLLIGAVNLLGTLILTGLYEGSVSKKVFTTIASFILMILIEATIVSIAINDSLDFFEKIKHDTLLISSIVKLATYIVTIIIYYLFSNKSTIMLPKKYYHSLIIIVGISAIMTVISFYSLGTSSIYTITMLVSIIVLSFTAFFMYRDILNLFEERQNEIRLQNQYELIKIQKESIEESAENLRRLEHDLRNKLTPIAFMVKDNNVNISDYINEIINEFSEKTVFNSSGLTELDSIVNIKMKKAESAAIDFSYDIRPIGDCPVSGMDLAVIVGNLLDNAIEACLKIDNGWIEISVRIVKGVLIIEVSNNFDGNIKKNGDEFVSRKENKDFHGMGIRNIKDILKKYDGEIEFSYSGTIFKALVLVYPK